MGDNVKVIRVYSKAIERKDFPGPNSNLELFHQVTTHAKCEEKYREYSLHYLTRKKNPRIREMEDEFTSLHPKIPSLEKREEYRHLVKNTETLILKCSRVDIVLCTCNEASSHRIRRSIKPTYCIIDECAMATEPECMVPIRCAEHVVLIGDHQQLQPIIKHKEANLKGLGCSLFERYVMKVGVQPHMLRVQYRMHPALCEFPSREFYQGALETDALVIEALQNDVNAQCSSAFWPKRGKPFVFCHVVGVEETELEDESKSNSEEAVKIVEIAQVLTNIHRVKPSEIEILTPYSAQCKKIRDVLKQREIQVNVKTITENQGSECGIALLSTVRSKPESALLTDGERVPTDSHWMRESLGFITDRHQICVGLTRAKYGLVIVGNAVLLGFEKTWEELINEYKDEGCFKKENEFPGHHVARH